MGAGVATPASCAKRAFERQGHTVFLFTPKMWPELFDEAGTFDATALSRFFEVQRPDCLMLAEGIGACGLDAAVSRGVAVGMLAAARSEAEASVAKSSGAPFDFAITISGRSLRLEELDGFDGVVGACAPAIDAAYASTPIANLVAFGPGIMCLQDAMPARVAFFDELVADGRFGGAVRCFGAGWPERFASDPTFTHIAYSARSSAACVVFGDLGAGSQNANAPADARDAKAPADALLTDEALVLVHADGAKLACVGEGLAPWRAERMDICEKDVGAAREALIAAVAGQRSGDVAFESRRLPADSQGPFLDGSLLAALESVRVAVLGKAGTLTGYLRGMGKVAKEERAVVGKTVNEVRNVVEEALEARKKKLAAAEMEAAIDASAVDVTLPGRAQQMGTRHLINAITDEVSEIFLGLGYTVVHGPEVETDYYNFEALNAPKDHPSRSMQDTFYVRDLSGEASSVRGESDVLLRTQTSGVQVHVMEDQKPPIYIIAPGKVYRRDVADPSHLPQFTQIEGLVIDKGISFGDLKGTLDYFCKQMFGPDRKTRFRAHYFPFTEPSAEADVSCGVCGGTGHLHDGERCRMCKGTGWLEILGCGMVDPNVLSMSGIDPEEYSGFAFGVGVERVACLKYNVPDLRMLLEGDMRFLRQF